MDKKIIGFSIIGIIVISTIIGAGLFILLSNDTNENNNVDLTNNESIIGTWIGNLDVKDQVYYDDILTAEIKKFIFSEETVTYEIYMNGIKEVVTGNYYISTDDSMLDELEGLYGGMLFFEYHENGFFYFFVLNQPVLSINNAIFTRQQ